MPNWFCADVSSAVRNPRFNLSAALVTEKKDNYAMPIKMYACCIYSP